MFEKPCIQKRADQIGYAYSSPAIDFEKTNVRYNDIILGAEHASDPRHRTGLKMLKDELKRKMPGITEYPNKPIRRVRELVAL